MVYNVKLEHLIGPLSFDCGKLNGGMRQKFKKLCHFDKPGRVVNWSEEKSYSPCKVCERLV